MMTGTRSTYVRFFLAAIAVVCAGSLAAAADGGWRVDKASGEVSVAGSGVQPASLTNETILKSGDTIRTGRNGRVLLVRGKETILISPNSVIGIPAESTPGLSTTIIQQAGSILLDVEKRNVKHFEVETPYLAAVVKGTQFRVTVRNGSSKVDVLRGQVEVMDFKSGQFALVLPGQSANVSAAGRGGLSLSGSGTLSAIQRGTPRAPTVTPVLVPKQGLAVLRDGSKQNPGRITAPLGEVKLNYSKVTKGLAREATAASDLAQGKSKENGAAGAKTGASDNAANLAFGQADGPGNGLGLGNGNGGGNGGGNGLGLGLGGGNAGGNGNGGGNGGGGGVAAGLSGALPPGLSGTLPPGLSGTLPPGLAKKLLSDIRVKRDVVLVGRRPDGLALYRFRYLWSDIAYVGVMAQDVERVMPNAVERGADGYLRVDYAALGLEMQTWDEWLASRKQRENFTITPH